MKRQIERPSGESLGNARQERKVGRAGEEVLAGLLSTVHFGFDQRQQLRCALYLIERQALLPHQQTTRVGLDSSLRLQVVQCFVAAGGELFLFPEERGLAHLPEAGENHHREAAQRPGKKRGQLARKMCCHD